MPIAQGLSSTIKEEILNTLTNESMLKFYTGIIRVPCVINSPFRDDKHPSFSIFYTEYGICFRDFAEGYSYDIFTFIGKYLNLSYIDVLSRIYFDMDKIKLLNSIFHPSFINKNITCKKQKVKIKYRKVLSVKERYFNKNDLLFWEEFGISKKMLVFSDVHAISYFWVNGLCIKADKYAYCFAEFKDTNLTLKIYQPFSKKAKWINNHDSSVWDLWVQAMNTKSKKLIITSSRKDAMCLWENLGIPSISLQSESCLPKAHIVKILQDKFPTIYCLYDNDYNKTKNSGRIFGEKLSNLYNFKQIEIPDEYESKDPSDLFKKYGKETFLQIMKKILD